MTFINRPRIQNFIPVILFCFSSCAYMTHETAAPASPESVAEVMHEHTSEFKSCFDTGLHSATGPVSGQVLLEWTLTASGKAIHTRVTNNTLKVPGVGQCLVRRVNHIQFSTAQLEVPVKYPFAFNKL